MAAAIKLIVGLGNPGPEHLLTRHNAGFWFVDALAGKYDLRFRHEPKFHAGMCRLAIPSRDCFLCRPESYMNESGRVVQAVVSFYKFAPEEILVVHDEIDLPTGVIRLKQGGGHGGHNGLRDIIEALGSGNFNRVRIGVGHPGSSDLVVGHVLNRAPPTEEEQIMQAIAMVLEFVPQILEGKLQLVMNKLHSSEKIKVESEKGQKDSNNNT